MGAFGGIAWAAIPDTNHLVHVCFKASDATSPGGASLAVIDSDRGGSCRARQSALSLSSQGSSAGIVSGTVAADGTVLQQQGGLTATMLAPGLFVLRYPGFDASHPGVVTGSAVTAFGAAAPSTFERIPSDDANLVAALGGAPTGIIVRSVRFDGSTAPFDVHIDLTSAP